MFLAVDVGNTHTTIGLMHNGEVLHVSRLTTQRGATADELKIMLRFLGGIEGIPRENWRGAAVCSVVPSINSGYCEAIESVTGVAPMLLRSSLDLGMRNKYQNPLEVGMDRLANAVAGIEFYGKPLIVVDFGTATTLDIVSPEGDYLGGVIIAGVESTADALHRRTSQLPRVSVERPDSALGRSTTQAIMSGLYYGAIDAVEGIISRIESEMGVTFRVIGTGGLAKVLKTDMKRLEAVDDHLTLKGIQLIWQRFQ